MVCEMQDIIYLIPQTDMWGKVTTVASNRESILAAAFALIFMEHQVTFAHGTTQRADVAEAAISCHFTAREN